ncbi:MAG: ribosome recycling factor [Crocinitomicaceae bacterium]|jgi:ribosome recycling factor|tara:strand:- start:23718 stop:24281 length:564 start_codon:yes stop_codon:yes gene_type:complete
MIEELQMIYDELKTSNNNSLQHFDSALSKIRAGKASPSMLSGIMVEYYEAMTPLQQVANVSVMDARTLIVQPWEKSSLNDLAKGIIDSNIGLNPQNNGEQLIISIPPLTEERRRDLVKKAKSESENAKVGVRNNRKDALDMIKEMKNDGLSEDMMKNAEVEIQEITNLSSKQIDAQFEIKEKDIMTV